MFIRPRISSQSGFSLIEMAISIMIIGAIIATSSVLYAEYIRNKNEKKTESATLEISNALGAFRALYGRYPCPSSLTAARGSATYGHEDANCKASPPSYPTSGTCSGGICAATSLNTVTLAAVDRPVLIGTLPFKIMGLDEDDIYDGYGNRLTYAVMASMTAYTSFDPNKGGLGLVDRSNDTIITPVNSAHFVVLSHGENKIGGFSAGGIETSACSTGSANEQENCDDDSIFLFGSKTSSFDDRVQYYTSIANSYWQKEDTGFDDIFLRGVPNAAVGALVSDDLSTAENLTVRKTNPDSGNILVEDGSVLSSLLCEYNASVPIDDCFPSSLISGTSSTLDCGSNFLVGITKTPGNAIAPTCSSEIFISCPNGRFIAGIQDGVISCDVTGTGSCISTNKVSSCGETKSLPFGSDGVKATTLSGKCHVFQNPAYTSAAYWATWLPGKTTTDINNHINTINAEVRDEIDCNTSELPSNGTSTALIRDTYICNNGTWDHAVAHERFYNANPFPTDLLSTAQPAVAEILTPYSLTHDPDRSIGDHDCWCRQDLRAQSGLPCGNGYAAGIGSRNIIEFTHCPSTADGFWPLYEDRSGCVCDGSGTHNEFPTCVDYYNTKYGASAPVGSLEGSVVLTWPRRCDASGVSVPDFTNPPTEDISQCICRPKDNIVVTTPCPTNTTNSYTVPGEVNPRTGVATVTITSWTCPGLNGDGYPMPGSWGTPDVRTDVPACTCTGGPVPDEERTKPCSSFPNTDPRHFYTGDGIREKRSYNCTTRTWGSWTTVSTDCRPCAWRSSDTPYLDSIRQGQRINSACSCNETGQGLCYDNAAGGMFNIFGACRCLVNDL